MARVFARGQFIPFQHSFYDSSGDLTQPTSATLIISYPSSGFPYRGLMDSTTISMTMTATTVSTADDYLTYKATWASGVAYPGNVYWTIQASDLALSVADGQFKLKGNPANLAVISTSTST